MTFGFMTDPPLTLIVTASSLASLGFFFSIPLRKVGRRAFYAAGTNAAIWCAVATLYYYPLKPWTPTWSAGGKPDPEKVRQEAAALVLRGKYNEALQRYLWYHAHALEIDPGLFGTRLLSLSDWMELGRRYPKAKEALTKIRNRDVREFAEGRGFLNLFMEVTSINRELQDEESTHALFKVVERSDAYLAKQCYPFAESALAHRCEYAVCLSYIGDPEAQFYSIRQAFEMDRESTNRTPSLTYAPEMTRKPANEKFVARIEQLMKILEGTGHHAEAEKIRTEALATLDDMRLRSTYASAKPDNIGNDGPAEQGSDEETKPEKRKQ
jgi:tetratricopeptide (TPR) repeat protein